MSLFMSERPLDQAGVTQYLNEAFDTSDMAVICSAIGDVMRLFNVADIARKAGRERPSLYRAFSGNQSPNFSTVLAVLDAMNLQIKVVPQKAKTRKR
jgi:probable addiction module antidote protein